MSGTGPKKKHNHQEEGALAETAGDGAHVCNDCSLIYQSPIVLPLDKVKQLPGDNVFNALNGKEDLMKEVRGYLKNGVGNQFGLPIATPLKFYLSQLDPQDFKENYESKILNSISSDKRLVEALSSIDVAKELNANLVQHFIDDRKLEFDLEHRVFNFFERFKAKIGMKKEEATGEYDTLADQPKNLGLVSRYVRRMLNNPNAFDGSTKGASRKEIFSYLLPNILAILDDKDSPDLAYARDKLAAVMLDSMGEDKLKEIMNPATYQVEVIDSAKGALAVAPKPMDAENYKTNSFDIFVKNGEGISQGAVRYMGKSWDFGGAHFHTTKPEHDFGNGEKHKGEIHLVFKSHDRHGFLVLGAPIVIGKENPAVAEALAKQIGGKDAGNKDASFSFLDLLPEGTIPEKNLSYFGSLTTSPYKAGGGVRFVLSKDKPLEVSEEQLAQLDKIAGLTNSRKPQNWMGRIITEIKGMMKSEAPAVS